MNFTAKGLDHGKEKDAAGAGMTTNEAWWFNELSYIESIDPANPGATFNHDPECFIGYCRMQINQAKRDGIAKRGTSHRYIVTAIIQHYMGA